MGGLFSALQTTSTALNVYTQALGIAQANVANASTPGYAAQSANILPIDLSGGGALSGNGAAGSDFISLTSSGNALTDATVQAASSQAGASQTAAQQLSPINQLFDITGATGILAALQQFSTAFSSLSVTPDDVTLGANALAAAGNVAAAFQTVAGSLDTQQSQIASGIQSVVGQINTLAGQIQQLNVTAGGESQIDPGTGASLRSDLQQLSSLVDITTTTNPNGSVSVLAGGQLPLVLGDQAYTLSANPSAAAGSQIASSGAGNSPDSFSGQLGALLDTQNNTINPLLGANGNPGTLNTLASGFAARVNTLLTSGVTSGGAAGVPIFTYDLTDPTNAARTLALDPSVTASQLGLASTDASGAVTQSNGIANTLAALPSSTDGADLIDGQSAEGLFGSIAASAGQRLSDAQTASTADQTALTTAQANQQQQEGVSLDQQAVNVTTYERAYQANAQVVSVLNQLTADVVNLISPTAAA
ncbi:MAG: flagellar hook-associated protein FlgK [Bryobacteraceae bacterium]|jgi:flagellar hook-associated protein 1 FlgK